MRFAIFLALTVATGAQTAENQLRTVLSSATKTPPSNGTANGTVAVLLHGHLAATTVVADGGGSVFVGGIFSLHWKDERLQWTGYSGVDSLLMSCGMDVWCPDIQGLARPMLAQPLRRLPSVKLYRSGIVSLELRGQFRAGCLHSSIYNFNLGNLAPFGSPSCTAYLGKLPISSAKMRFSSTGLIAFASSPFPPSTGRLSIQKVQKAAAVGGGGNNLPFRSLDSVEGQGDQRLPLLTVSLRRAWEPVWYGELMPQCGLALLVSLLPWVGPEVDTQRLLAAGLLLLSLCSLWHGSLPDPLSSSTSSVGQLHGMLGAGIALLVVLESATVCWLQRVSPRSMPAQEGAAMPLESTQEEEEEALRPAVRPPAQQSRTPPPRQHPRLGGRIRGMAKWIQKPMARQMPAGSNHRPVGDSDMSQWLDEIGFRMMEPRFNVKSYLEI